MDPAGASARQIEKTEGCLYFDPRFASARGTAPLSVGRATDHMPDEMSGAGGIQPSLGMPRQGFSAAAFFTVREWSMDEYGNLQEGAKRTGEQSQGGK